MTTPPRPFRIRSSPHPPSPLRRVRLALLALALTVATVALAVGLREHRGAAADGSTPPVPTARTLDAIDREIAFYRQRSLAAPGDGLDLAALAGAYLARAQVSGYAPWYLLAEQTARRSLANLPVENVEARLVLAEIAEARHAFDEALELAAGVLAERPGHPRALAIRAGVLLAQGDPAAAEAAASTLVERLPTPASLSLLGVIQAARADDAAARRSFDAAAALEQRGDARGAAWLRIQQARLELRRGRLDAAEARLDAALAIVPDHPLARLERAALRLAQGRARAAERLYDAVLETGADTATVFDHVALQGVARARELRGDRAGAEAAWQRAETTLRADGNRDAFGHDRELARLLLERGRAEDLPEALELLRAETARRRDADTLDLLAWALSESGRVAEAQAVAAEALALGPTPAALARAARVADAAGDPVAATRFRERRSVLAPGFDDRVQRALGHGG